MFYLRLVVHRRTILYKRKGVDSDPTETLGLCVFLFFKMDWLRNAIAIINHGCSRGAVSVVVRYSKHTVLLCKMLEREGFISGYSMCRKPGKRGILYSYIEIYLMLYRNVSVMRRIYRITHAGHHRYFQNRELREIIAQNRTFYVVSTNIGWLTLNECIRRGIGGELLFGVVY